MTRRERCKGTNIETEKTFAENEEWNSPGDDPILNELKESLKDTGPKHRRAEFTRCVEAK